MVKVNKKREKGIRIPIRYLPNKLTKKDKKKQVSMLLKSRKQYKKGKYVTRDKISSYKSKKSNHITNAQQLYNVSKIVPNKELAAKTGCKIEALQKIVNKGEGAYFSSGSRPNQTAKSWGLARLASAITAGKAAAIDYNIISEGCDHKKRAFILALKSRRKNGYGLQKTKKVSI
jgi:nitrate reductase beta subunit